MCDKRAFAKRIGNKIGKIRDNIKDRGKINTRYSSKINYNITTNNLTYISIYSL